MDCIEIEDICKQYNIKNWSVEDGLVNVDGNVTLQGKGLTELPLQFGKVSGYFNCCSNKLKSLKGSPNSVGGNFYCAYNKLTSLKYAPKYINFDFYCHNNNLSSLEYAPEYVGNDFTCYHNNLTSLEYAPNHVGNDFSCFHNKITSLKGSPEYVGGYFNCTNNKLTSLKYLPKNIGEIASFDNNYIYGVNYIPYKFTIKFNPAYNIYGIICGSTHIEPKYMVDIDYFNDCKIIIGKDIYLDRFKAFLYSYGLESDINVEELKEAGYTIK